MGLFSVYVYLAVLHLQRVLEDLGLLASPEDLVHLGIQSPLTRLESTNLSKLDQSSYSTFYLLYLLRQVAIFSTSVWEVNINNRRALW